MHAQPKRRYLWAKSIGPLLSGVALWLVTLTALADPQLVTPQLPAATLGQPYAASLMVGSTLPLASAALTGMPAGLSFAHNGFGNIAISGTPTAPGSFVLNVSAADGAATLNASVVLTVHQVTNTVTSVSAGNDHSCAVASGGVQCWGGNASGQLGDGGLTTSLVSVHAILAGSGATLVSAGDNSTCAVVNGGVQCWGAGRVGQLGNGTAMNVSSPVQTIAAGGNVTAISVGGGHACAVVNGGVQCWGFNTNGQLGNNSTTQSLVPVQTIPPGSGATAVSAGSIHSCAVINGGVKCWGYNGDGRLGIGSSTVPSLVPVQTIVAGSGVTSVDAGTSHSCAIVNGGVQCWGANFYGQIGNNSSSERLAPVQVIAAGGSVTALSAGEQHTCAVVSGGMQCWGDNSQGQLGNNKAPISSLVPLQTVVAGSSITGVSAGKFHNCAVVNGGVQCWGSGILGRGIAGASLVPAVEISAGRDVKMITTGGAHKCIVVTGGVQCWGANDAGQLGNGSLAHSLVPVQAIAAGSNVTAVAAGGQHTCALVAGGVQCWGSNNAGALGDGSAAQRSSVPVQAIPAGGNATALATGNLHSCAVVKGGVQCWGNNFRGQLGNNSTTNSGIPVQIIAAGSNATSVSAGSNHTCALVNGGVQCWGSNGVTQSLIPVQMIAPGSGVTAIASGGISPVGGPFDFTCAVLNGGVQCWGANTVGQFGNGSTTGSAVPVQVIPAGSNVTGVGLGYFHSCVVLNGGVQCSGSNSAGQLGNNSTTASPLPVQAIAAGSNVTAVSAASYGSCALVNGAVVCWGPNFGGEFGEANGSNRYRPALAIAYPTSAPVSMPMALLSNSDVAAYGGPLSITATVAGNGQTGTVAFSVVTSNGVIPLPACSAVTLGGGTASCTVPGAYQNQNPRQYQAAYSGDIYNPPSSSSLSQRVALNTAVVTVAAHPLPPIIIGGTTTLTALVKMSNPVGTVAFSNNGVPVAGCTQQALTLLPNTIDAAVASCLVTAPASPGDISPFVATYSYPTGHPSGKAVEQATYNLRIGARNSLNYTDMWWAGTTENGWGMSVTQHGPIQFNVIFAYDKIGRSLWYVMPSGRSNSTLVDNVFTGALYLPTSSPFSAYDRLKFSIGVSVGSAAIAYDSDNSATLTYTISGVTTAKSIQRQVFANETVGPNLRVNDLWWATAVEDGWGMNIAQQGRVLFPIWYTYDAGGKSTFFTAQNGSWSGTVWTGTIFSHASSAWLGVAYNPAAFTSTNVGTISLDFSDASNAIMTTSVNGFTQVRRIERQPF